MAAKRTLKDYENHKDFSVCKKELESKGLDFAKTSEEEVLKQVADWFTSNGKRLSKKNKTDVTAVDDISKIVEKLLQNKDLSDDKFRVLTGKAYGLKSKLSEIAKKKEQLAELENEIKTLEAAYEADKKEILSYK